MVPGTWDRWRKGQSRESVTHERMMERFAALSKQPLGSWTHLAGLLLLFLYTKLPIQQAQSHIHHDKPGHHDRWQPISQTVAAEWTQSLSLFLTTFSNPTCPVYNILRFKNVYLEIRLIICSRNYTLSSEESGYPKMGFLCIQNQFEKWIEHNFRVF